MKRIALAAVLLLAAAAIAGVARPEGAHAVDGAAAVGRLDHRLRQRLRGRRPDDRRVLVRRRHPRRHGEGGLRRTRARCGR